MAFMTMLGFIHDEIKREWVLPWPEHVINLRVPALRARVVFTSFRDMRHSVCFDHAPKTKNWDVSRTFGLSDYDGMQRYIKEHYQIGEEYVEAQKKIGY